MESLIRLNIKSTALKQRYYEKRSSEILKISVAIWILTVLFNISSTLTDIYSGTYSFQFLLASYICLAVHFSLILLTKRFPTQLCFLHSPVLVLLMVPCMLWYNPVLSCTEFCLLLNYCSNEMVSSLEIRVRNREVKRLQNHDQTELQAILFLSDKISLKHCI